MKPLFILLLILLYIVLIGCSPSEKYINNEIEKANYCNTKYDCVNAGDKCPFGCYVFVNKNEITKIKNLIDSYKSNCIYSCAVCEADCKNNKCATICS